MCTVTYIAQPNRNFLLTSNRDENTARSPQNLTRSNGLIFPRDTAAGGTWIAASATNRVVCLLNGAFEKHHHKPPYKRSRGLMVLDFFDFPEATDFFETYDFEGIEPFTLIVVDDGKLYELRWDEQQAHVLQLDAAAGRYLWSSATLYPKEVQEMRQGWFEEWLKNRLDFSAEALQKFHRTGGEGDSWNGFLMNRNNVVQTVSISQIIRSDDRIELIYNDLLRETVKRESVQLAVGGTGSTPFTVFGSAAFTPLPCAVNGAQPDTVNGVLPGTRN